MSFDLKVEDLLVVIERLNASDMFNLDEQIPFPNEYRVNKLKACVESIYATFDEIDLYPDIISKSSHLFYSIIKNHPLENGNKRIAVTALFIFLNIQNDKWLKVSPSELYEFAIEIADSELKDKDRMVAKIKKFIKKNIVDFYIQ